MHYIVWRTRVLLKNKTFRKVRLNCKTPCRCNIAHGVIRTSWQNWKLNREFPNLRVNPEQMNTLLSTLSKAACGEGEEAETTRLYKARKITNKHKIDDRKTAGQRVMPFEILHI